MAEPVKKKQKLQEVPLPSRTISKGLEPISLSYYTLPLNVGKYQGSFQGNRIAIQVEDRTCLAYVATGKRIHKVSVELPSGRHLERGKEGAIIPIPSKASLSPELLATDLAFQSEIQNLAVYGGRGRFTWGAAAAGATNQAAGMDADSLLAAVDATGASVLVPLARGGAVAGAPIRLPNPNPSRVSEPGWAGIALHGRLGGDSATDLEAAVARQFCRDVALYDVAAGGRIVRTWGATQCPAALLFIPCPSNGAGAGAGGKAQCAAAKLNGGKGTNAPKASCTSTATSSNKKKEEEDLNGDDIATEATAAAAAATATTGSSSSSSTVSSNGGAGSVRSGRSLVAVAEDSQVTLWDVRQAERGGLVAAVQAAPQGFPIWTMALFRDVVDSYTLNGSESGSGSEKASDVKDASHGSYYYNDDGCYGSGSMYGTEEGAYGGGNGEWLLSLAGAERALTTLETRSMRWRVHSKWSGCVKYPVTHLAISRANPRFAYVAGLDYECVAGRWDGSTGSSACSGNSNSGQSSGHGGRAVGRLDDERLNVVLKGSNPLSGLSFRGSAKWIGMALAASSRRIDDRTGNEDEEEGDMERGEKQQVEAARKLSGRGGARVTTDVLVTLSLTGGLYVGEAMATGVVDGDGSD